jgi:DUF4097 and DUF4098 domain-containing protein YvlB
MESIDVTIDLPSGSHVRGDSDMGSFTAEGRLGECWLKTAMGDIRLGETKALLAKTSFGAITGDQVAGDADVVTGSGEVRIGPIAGNELIKNSNGDTKLGEVTGDLRVRAANGDISVDRTHGSVTAKTANGNVRIGEVAGGAIVLETAAGEILVGIRKGTPAWLDVSTQYGQVHNALDPSDSPKQSEAAVDVRARTSYGDIVISRSTV